MDQVAFTIGGLTVHWYGILVVTGFVAGLWTASRRAPLGGMSGEVIADIGVWLMVGAIAGSRLFYVVQFWQEEFASAPWWEMFAIHHGGLVFYGGLIGASLATVFFARRRELPLWRLADILAPSIALGHAFGRLGCLMYGCCFGSVTSVPWGLHYPAHHVTGGTGVHPTQIYEALLDLALYGGLAWLFQHRRRFEGQVFATYLIAYPILRFGVEMFRGDYAVRYFGGWVTPGQMVSVVVLGAGLGLYAWLRSGRPPTSPDRRGP